MNRTVVWDVGLLQHQLVPDKPYRPLFDSQQPRNTNRNTRFRLLDLALLLHLIDRMLCNLLLFSNLNLEQLLGLLRRLTVRLTKFFPHFLRLFVLILIERIIAHRKLVFVFRRSLVGFILCDRKLKVVNLSRFQAWGQLGLYSLFYLHLLFIQLPKYLHWVFALPRSRFQHTFPISFQILLLSF